MKKKQMINVQFDERTAKAVRKAVKNLKKILKLLRKNKVLFEKVLHSSIKVI